MSQELIQLYFQHHDVRKLHLGCGPNVLNGWLNTDFPPKEAHILGLDVTRSFPFDDQTFDYIFNEHMIEHITYQQGMFMLRNCYRVLKPNGKIRLSTPDLSKLLALFSPEKTEEQRFYIRTVTDWHMLDLDEYHETFVLNNAFRNWGHMFLYDAHVLTRALQRVGFVNITPCQVSQSEDLHLQNIDCRTDAISIYETMVFEGTRA